jgi:WD40 repeat protein
MFSIDKILFILESRLGPGDLTHLQKQVLRGVLEGKTYTEIAKQLDYSTEHVKETGYRLWQSLSVCLGQRVSKKNLRSILEQELQATAFQQTALGSGYHQDWSNASTVSGFVGRQAELTQLQRGLSDRARILAICGMGGIGKTSLATKFVELVQAQFAFTIWCPLQNAPRPEQTVVDWLQIFTPDRTVDGQSAFAPNLARLMVQLRQHRCLLILDNYESILAAGDECGSYREGYEGYGELLQWVSTENHQSCVLLTGRELPRNIPYGQSVRILTLKGLLPQEGEQILQQWGLTTSQLDCWQLLDRYNGNPLALSLVAATIQEIFHNDLELFLDQTPVLFGDVYNLLAQQFDRLSELERQLMVWLAINREQVSLPQLSADLWPTVPQRLVLEALLSLQRRSLIEVNQAQFALQPVLMEFVTGQILEQAFQEIQIGDFNLLDRHALLKTTVPDYIHQIQIRLLIAPLAERLQAEYSRTHLAQKLSLLLKPLQIDHHQSYAAGNLINLWRQLNLDLTGCDLSGLYIRQADLRDLYLQRSNLRGAHLEQSLLTEKLTVTLRTAFSADGDILATAGFNGEIALWQLASGTKLSTLQTAGYVVGLIFAPDDPYLISCQSDLKINLWNRDTQECLCTLSGHSHYSIQVILSADRQQLFSSSLDGTIKFWDINNGNCLKTLAEHSSAIWSIAISPDGKWLASGSSDRTIKLWDIHSGLCLQTLHGHSDEVRNVFLISLTNTRPRLVSSGLDQTIKFWDLAAGICEQTLKGHTHNIFCQAVNLDRQLLATGDDGGTIKLWSLQTGECLRSLAAHIGTVYSLTFHPTQPLLVSSALDGTVKLWDVRLTGEYAGQCLKVLSGHTSEVYTLAFSPNSQEIAAGTTDRKIHFWRSHSGAYQQCLSGHTATIWSIAFHPQGDSLVSSSMDGSNQIWDLSTGQAKTLSSGLFMPHQVVISPNGRWIASRGNREDEDVVQIWDGATGALLQSLNIKLDIFFAACFSPDSRWLVCNGEQATARLWNIDTEECLQVFQGHKGAINAVVFHPQGEAIITGSDDGTVKLWDVGTGKCQTTLAGHSGQIWSVAYAPPNEVNRSVLLASGGGDHVVRIWQVGTDKCLQTLVGHTADIRSVAFSPNGRYLASGSQDETIRIWDTKTWHCLQVLQPPRPYEEMDITGVMGLTKAQKATLQRLGALEVESTTAKTVQDDP